MSITAGWSGQSELVKNDAGYRVSYILEPARKQEGNIWYSATQNWAEINILNLRRRMRELAGIHQRKGDVFEAMSKNARYSIVDRFSPETVAERLNHILRELKN